MRWRSGPASSTLPAGRGVSNQLTLKLLAVAILVAASAVLTGAEAAYFSLGRARLRKLTGSTSEARSPLIERPHDLLVTLLVGITVINIGAAALAATLAEDVFGVRYGLLVEIIGMILILTTFGEVLPMTFAVKYPEQFLTLARGPVAWLSVILKPVRSTLGALTTLTVHLIGSERQAAQPELSEEELRTLVDVGAKEGVVEREEREMIHKVFELEDTLVRSVIDRKSTRLNSSHLVISYAVFCLKKKKRVNPGHHHDTKPTPPAYLDHLNVVHVVLLLYHVPLTDRDVSAAALERLVSCRTLSSCL